jgi:hypothetical protein
VDGNANTGNREHVRSTASTSVTVKTGGKLGEDVDGNAKTVIRDIVRRNVSQHVRYG